MSDTVFLSRKMKLRELPSVDEVLKSEGLRGSFSGYGYDIIKETVREVLETLRSGIINGKVDSFSMNEITASVEGRLKKISEPGLKKVVNASGTILHTNLGRAILCDEAVHALTIAAREPVNLEFDIEKGGRSERDARIEELLKILTSAPSGCVVNNNAGAVLLALNTFAEGKEVIISRGEMIEIGGSFRLPEIIKKSGCILKEVGTTNRTHPDDYASAITIDTALILKAHKSNYEVTGFTSEVGLKELVEIGREKGIPVFEDLGSGALIDLSFYGIKKEPVVRERIEIGADIVSFSADKLLGGPQAGIIAGKKEMIEKIRKNPLKRALRVDKLTLSALDATLRLYLNPLKELAARLPILRFITRPVEEIEKAAEKAKLLLTERLKEGYKIEIIDGESFAGSGSLPGHKIPTRLLSIAHPELTAEKIFRIFLQSTPSILGRISRERFILDMRAIERPEDVCPSA